MFCSKCGHEIVDGEKFCPKCGAPTVAESENKEVEVEATEENTVAQEVAAEARDNSEELKAEHSSASYDPVYVTEPVKGSTKKGLFIGLGIVAVLAIAALVVCFALGLFDSPQKTVAKLITNGKNSFIESYEEGYDSIQKSYKDISGDMTISMEASLGDQTKKLLNELSGMYNLDLSWIDSANAQLAMDVQEDQVGFDIKGNLNGQDIATVDVIVDANSDKMYYSIPELMQDTAFSQDLEDVSAEEIIEIISTYTDTIKSYGETYPDAKQLDKILTRYVDIINKDLATAEMSKSKDEITADGISQKTTKISIELDSRLINQLAVDLIDALEEDEDIKELYRPIFEKQIESGLYAGIFDDFDDLWSELIDGLDDVRSDAQDELDRFEKDAGTNDHLGVLNIYLGKMRSFKGISLVLDDSDYTVEYFTPAEGKKSATLLKVASDGEDLFTFEGSGQVDGSLFNGEYSLTFLEDDICTLKLVDFDVKEYASKRNFKGKLVLTLDPSLAEYMDDETAKLFTLADYDLSFETDGLNGTYDLEILSADESLLNIETSFKMEEVDDITLPATVYSADDMTDEETYELIKKLDLSTLISNLNKAGVPEEYYEKLSDLQAALESGDDIEIAYALSDLFGGTSYDYDYDYDDSYSDDYSIDDEIDYLASLSYDDFKEFYLAYYDSTASDDEIRSMYEQLQEYYGQ